MTYLQRTRSSRNMVAAGQIVIIALMLIFSYLALSADWINIYLRVFFTFVFFLMIFKAFQYIKSIIRNEKIHLIVTDDGIEYGGLFFEWDEIRGLYPRGGLTIGLICRYNIGLKLRKSVQPLNELTVDKGLTKKEFNALCDSLKVDLLSKKPKIKITSIR